MIEMFGKILQSFKTSKAKYMKIELGRKKYLEFEKKCEKAPVIQMERVSGKEKTSKVISDAGTGAEDPSLIKLLSSYVGIFKQVKEALTGGEKVKNGEILGTIESMGIVHEIESPVDGKIVEVNIKDNDIVEYEQLLFKVREEK